jgi:hypothetical protein
MAPSQWMTYMGRTVRFKETLRRLAMIDEASSKTRPGSGLTQPGRRRWIPSAGPGAVYRRRSICDYGWIRQYCGLVVPKLSGMLKELPPAGPINVRFWESNGSGGAQSDGLRRGDRLLT